MSALDSLDYQLLERIFMVFQQKPLKPCRIEWRVSCRSGQRKNMSKLLECERLALRAIQQFRHQQYHESRVALALIDSRWRDGSLVMSKRAIHALIKLSKAAES